MNPDQVTSVTCCGGQQHVAGLYRSLVSLPESRQAMITVIVLNWNGARDTLACVDSLIQLQGIPPNIIVCDNHSSDDSFISIDSHLRKISAIQTGYRYGRLKPGGTLPSQVLKPDKAYLGLVRTRTNLGFAGGVNVGLRLALQDPRLRFVWVLNNDTRVDPGALDALLDTLSTEPRIGLCGSTLLYLDDPSRIQAVGGRYNPWLSITRHVLGQTVYSPDRCLAVVTERIDYFVGVSMFFRRELLERVGPLSEDYFLYFEELDWAMRLRALAPEYRLGYSPRSLVYHKEGASSGANDRGGKTNHDLADYYFQTSRLRFASRYFPWRYGLVRLTQLGVALNRLRRKRWRSARLALALLLGPLPEAVAGRRPGSD